MLPLRHFDETHMREDCSEMSGLHDNELFYGCQFKRLNGLTLRNCVLNGSSLETDSVGDALGFTLSLDCFSFAGVKYSPLLFDLLLCLMISSSGNDEKRERLKDVVGSDRYAAIMRVLSATE